MSNEAHGSPWALLFQAGGEFDSGDFNFEAAEVGVIVFADAVGEVDEGAGLEGQLGGAGGEVPSDGADDAGCTGEAAEVMPPGQLEAEVTVFHDARGGEQASAAGDEHGLGVAVAERFELAEPSGEDGGNAVEGQLGVNVQDAFGFACGEVLFRIEAQAALEFGERRAGRAKPMAKA